MVLPGDSQYFPGGQSTHWDSLARPISLKLALIYKNSPITTFGPSIDEYVPAGHSKKSADSSGQ